MSTNFMSKKIKLIMLVIGIVLLSVILIVYFYLNGPTRDLQWGNLRVHVYKSNEFALLGEDKKKPLIDKIIVGGLVYDKDEYTIINRDGIYFLNNEDRHIKFIAYNDFYNSLKNISNEDQNYALMNLQDLAQNKYSFEVIKNLTSKELASIHKLQEQTMKNMFYYYGLSGSDLNIINKRQSLFYAPNSNLLWVAAKGLFIGPIKKVYAEGHYLYVLTEKEEFIKLDLEKEAIIKTESTVDGEIFNRLEKEARDHKIYGRDY